MTEARDTPLFIGRQPILGREQQLLAYELLFSDAPIATGNHDEVLDPAWGTAGVIARAFVGQTASEALGPYRAFINVNRDFLFSELIDALPPQQVVLELLESVQPRADVIARCQQLHHTGFTFAVDGDSERDAAYHALIMLADIITLDMVKSDGDALRERVLRFKPLGKKLLARNVESVQQFSICQNLGFELFQGYYFAKPEIIAGKKLNPSQLTLMRLLALVMDDADTSEIEYAFKAEPGLTINLLRLTNSASSGLSTTITSLRHAITLLGRQQLQRWLQLLIYMDPNGGTQSVNPLLQLAATRGRLMELLADRLQPRQREFADQAFMAGILSLMPVLLGMTISDLLDQLPVTPRVKQALINHGGQHGQLLRLVETTEQTDAVALEDARQHLPGITTDVLEAHLAQALSWANTLGQT